METRRTKKLISFGLWGNSPRYLVGAIENAKLAPQVYPGWGCRFYVPAVNVGREVMEDDLDRTIFQLIDLGADIAPWPEGIFGMYARFTVSDDPTVERFIVRDADSRLSEREAVACQQWIDSGKILWSVREHPAHCRGLNGGLFGAVGGALPNMERSIRDWVARQPSPEFIYGQDQDFLGQVIWTKFHMHAMQHDSCCGYAGSVPFPTKRIGYRFVGEVFEADGTPRAGDWEAIIPNS